jgi:DDE family transposase
VGDGVRVGARTGRWTVFTTRCVTRCAPGAEQRNPEPSSGIVDAQSVKGADTVSAETRGYDAGKKINGRKRHIVCDMIGLLLVVMVTAASLQDRDGGRGILKRLYAALGSVSHIFAAGGYQGQSGRDRQTRLGDRDRGRSWASQPTSAALRTSTPQGGRANLLLAIAVATACARLRTAAHEAMVKWAMVGLMLNRLAPPLGPKPRSSKKKRE